MFDSRPLAPSKKIAILAQKAGKPLYVAAESFKLVRSFPLSQRDLPDEHQPVDFGSIPSAVGVISPASELVPPELITLLFTDLGVLTPSAVSDELIRLYR